MAIAVIQEFPIQGGDRTTTNYDRIQGSSACGTTRRPARAFCNDRLLPIVQPLLEQGVREPATRIHELHDFMA